MKVFFYTGCLAFTLLFLGACNKADAYEEKAKSLDSLNGAVSSIARKLQTTDTLLLQRSVQRYLWYKQFVEQNIHDTISKEEADNLQRFYSSGKSIENFSINRKLLLERATLVSAQLNQLAQDAKKKTITEEQLSQFWWNEKKEASRLIEAGYQQQQLFHTSVEEFRNALRGVEVLIKSRNKGELPVIIKDTISL